SGAKDELTIGKYLKAFPLLDSDQIYEVLLAYCRKFSKTEKYTKLMLGSDLRKLWNLGLMIKIISSVNPSKYEKKFADRCKNLANYNGKNFTSESNKFYADLWGLVKDKKDEFIQNFNDILVYRKDNDSNNELIRFILLTLYQRDDNKGITYEVKTVEHILSQSKYEQEDFLHRIGNLTILSMEMNRAASNKDFDSKYKEYYSKDIFNQNKNLNKYPFDTDPVLAISRRARDLAEASFSAFSFF
ncbi:HNH endonuclease family protein, partial [Patescibacteria group bacterium]|nr:HNH endonuclease family protein [Patescibacteria group bacterium]MBU1921762.1 HNH endonuclease family protein [Patescibacteria group bacterium]